MIEYDVEKEYHVYAGDLPNPTNDVTRGHSPSSTGENRKSKNLNHKNWNYQDRNSGHANDDGSFNQYD
jgi:hypothetical protein